MLVQVLVLVLRLIQDSGSKLAQLLSKICVVLSEIWCNHRVVKITMVLPVSSLFVVVVVLLVTSLSHMTLV